jgi:putative methyltransferase (TIGR04325 family)
MTRQPLPKRVLRGVRRRWRDLWHPLNSFAGIYSSFAEAASSAPATKPLGYDEAGSADWYENKMSRLHLEDYPVAYWLREAFGAASHVFEIGGHVGTAYYGFQQVLRYPAGLEWTIWDVPSICEAGRALAARRQATNLQFTADPALASRAEILLAAGSLQYIDSPSLTTILRKRRGELRHVILNLLPAHSGASFVTLQNLGSAYAPYRVFNREELVAGVEREGFDLVDSWEKPRPFRLQFRHEVRFESYSGFYFVARG